MALPAMNLFCFVGGGREVNITFFFLFLMYNLSFSLSSHLCSYGVCLAGQYYMYCSYWFICGYFNVMCMSMDESDYDMCHNQQHGAHIQGSIAMVTCYVHNHI